MGDLPARPLPPLHPSAKVLEGLDEEVLDVMRLHAINVTWDLHMLHWDQASGLLYISSSAKGPFDRVAKAACGDTARRVEGEVGAKSPPIA